MQEKKSWMQDINELQKEENMEKGVRKAEETVAAVEDVAEVLSRKGSLFRALMILSTGTESAKKDAPSWRRRIDHKGEEKGKVNKGRYNEFESSGRSQSSGGSTHTYSTS